MKYVKRLGQWDVAFTTGNPIVADKPRDAESSRGKAANLISFHSIDKSLMNRYPCLLVRNLIQLELEQARKPSKYIPMRLYFHDLKKLKYFFCKKRKKFFKYVEWN